MRKVSMAIQVDKKNYQNLKKESVRTGRSMSFIIRELLDKHYQEVKVEQS